MNGRDCRGGKRSRVHDECSSESAEATPIECRLILSDVTNIEDSGVAKRRQRVNDRYARLTDEQKAQRNAKRRENYARKRPE